MNKPEFVGLQISVLIRSDEAQSQAVQTFLETVEFKGGMQDKVARLVQDSLKAGNVPFHEVIISLDKPPQRAKPVERSSPPRKKSSRLGRLFGRR